jgi:hypothetical protein
MIIAEAVNIEHNTFKVNLNKILDDRNTVIKLIHK